MQIYFNPNIYEQYFEVAKFLKTMAESPEHVCKFLFCENNSKQNSLDTVFEYGYSINKFKMNERQFWFYLNDLLDSLILLELQGFHFPEINKHSFIISNDKIKLINPFCYKDFLKDVLGIYMNPMKGVAARTAFRKNKIRENCKQFGIVFLAFLMNCNEENTSIDFNKNKLELTEKFGLQVVEGLFHLASANQEIYSFQNIKKVLWGKKEQKLINEHKPINNLGKKSGTSPLNILRDSKHTEKDIAFFIGNPQILKTEPASKIEPVQQIKPQLESIFGKIIEGLKTIAGDFQKIKNQKESETPIPDCISPQQIEVNQTEDISNTDLINGFQFMNFQKKDTINLNELFKLKMTSELYHLLQILIRNPPLFLSRNYQTHKIVSEIKRLILPTKSHLSR